MSNEIARTTVDDGPPDGSSSLRLDHLETVTAAGAEVLAALGPDLVGRSFAEFLSDVDREPWPVPRPDGTTERFPGLLLFGPGARDSVPRWVVTSAARRDDDGGYELLGRIPTADDLRIARVSRDARFQIVGRLASGVAHELNNILSTVTTFSDLLLARLRDDASATEDLKEIKDAATEASHVLRKLDLFAGGRAKGSRPVHVADVFAGMDKLLRRFLPDGIEVSVQTSPDCPHVHVDPLRLEEALFALIVDARDSVPAGGRVLIQAGPADGEAPFDDAVRLAVEWTPPEGEGSDVAATEPSVLVDRGSGLGPSVVHRMAAAAGGGLGTAPTAAGGIRSWLDLPGHVEASAVIGG